MYNSYLSHYPNLLCMKINIYANVEIINYQIFKKILKLNLN